jgi:hypothetical protein
MEAQNLGGITKVRLTYENVTILPSEAIHKFKRKFMIRSSELDTKRNLSRECVGYLVAIVIVRKRG